MSPWCPISVLRSRLACALPLDLARRERLRKTRSQQLKRSASRAGIECVLTSARPHGHTDRNRQSDQLTNVPSPQGVVRASRDPVCSLPALSRCEAQRDRRYERRYAVLAGEPRPDCRTDSPIKFTEMGDRFRPMQIIDAWNDVPGAPGAVAVLARRKFCVGRAQMEGRASIRRDRDPVEHQSYDDRWPHLRLGKSDYGAVHNLQDQYRLTPLSKSDRLHAACDSAGEGQRGLKDTNSGSGVRVARGRFLRAPQRLTCRQSVTTR